MNASLRSAPFALVLILAIGAPLALHRHPPANSETGAESREVNRIRFHFDSVLSELTSRDLASLSASQRANRARLVRTLAAYRDRGVFPHNYDFPDQATPYFVDRKTGTLCAVAHLLASTGRTDIVYQVARVDNNVHVAQLAGDTAFDSWLAANGLTLDEAARIQVPYAMMSQPEPSSRSALNGTAVIAGVGAAAAGIWNATANWDGHRGFPRVFGMATGFLASGVGLVLLSQDRPSRTAGPLMMGIGGLSIGLATHAITHHNGVVKAQREAAQRKASPVQASIAPYLGPDRSAGILLSIAF